MACNGVDCRGGSFFFFFIYTLKQEKEQWRKWDISASTYFATEYRTNKLTCIIFTGTSCDVYETCRFRFSRTLDLPCFLKKKKRNGYKNWKINNNHAVSFLHCRQSMMVKWYSAEKNIKRKRLPCKSLYRGVSCWTNISNYL